MASAYAIKLGIIIKSTNVGAEKINSSPLIIYEMITARFFVQDKFGIKD